MTFYPLIVLDRISETKDAASFVLNVPAALKDTFAYASGQFLTFEIPWNEFTIQRCYSLSSSPLTDSKPKFTVKRVVDGRASNWFNEQVHKGMQIMVAPPSGRFLLKDEHDGPLMLFAGGSGITPIISLLKTTLQVSNRPIQLVYANRDVESVIFGKELERLAQENPQQLKCHYHYDDCGEFLDTDTIENVVNGRWNADFYLCGPTPFMDLVEGTLTAHLVPDAQIHIERFVSSVDPDTASLSTLGSSGADFDDSEVTLKITTDGKNFNADYVSGKSLLESILADPSIDTKIPYSCQQGHCGSCMAMLRGGEVSMRHNRVLSKRDLAKGYVLACQSIPTSNEVWIDFDV